MRASRSVIKVRAAVAASLAAVFMTAACGGGSDSSDSSSDTIQVGYSGSSLEVSQFSLWLPEALGYWEDEGLKVEVNGFPGNTELLQAVVAGKVDVSSATTVPLLDAVAKDQPLKATYSVYTSSMFGLSVPKDSKIKDLKDIRGKTIGVSSMTDGQVPQIKAQMEEAGLSESDYDMVAIGRGDEAGAFLEKGRVDVIGLWDAQFYILEQEHDFELRELDAPLVADTGFGYVMSTREDDIKPRHDQLVGLLRGVAKATAFARENPEATAELFFEKFPEALPAGMDKDEAIKREAGQLEVRLEIVKPTDGVYGLGTEEKISEFIQIFTGAGVITEGISPSDMYTDELLEEVNDFDEEEVREEAGK